MKGGTPGGERTHAKGSGNPAFDSLGPEEWHRDGDKGRRKERRQQPVAPSSLGETWVSIHATGA